MHDIRPYLPELFSQPGTLLYIGARADAHSWLEELYQAGHQITILEIWPANVAGLLDWIDRNNLRMLVLARDVRQIDRVKPSLFDYIFYWHGPEHLEPGEVGPLLARLEARTRRTLALASPWGLYPQGAHNGNEYETHRWSVYPADLRALGYETATDGEADRPGSEVVGWKRK